MLKDKIAGAQAEKIQYKIRLTNSQKSTVFGKILKAKLNQDHFHAHPAPILKTRFQKNPIYQRSRSLLISARI